MSKAPCAEAEAKVHAELPASVLYILRCEGLAVAVLTAILYARSGASWWLFAALWLAPDLSLLGYFAGPSLGARIYNSVHAYATPITLAVCALLVGAHALVPIALIWGNHIAVDRLLGFGLKYPAGFGWTHLGRVGRAQATPKLASPAQPRAAAHEGSATRQG
ncbi:MAG TPA: DUF4260 domain-containing protein [Terracidiphilus sp.]|jgi:hypothetical protein|nr:DUF4260 domain-containing protein [Terracidiphilus sp.]